MKKISKLLVVMAVITLTLTGCKEKNVEGEPEVNTGAQTVVAGQHFENFEFAGFKSEKEGYIKTVIINNSGYLYEGSKVSIKIMDSNNQLIEEVIEDVKVEVPTGNTYTFETKVNKDISKVAYIEYSIVNK